MVRRICVALALFSALSATIAIAQDQPLPLEGFVTRAVSFADFDINGLHVLFNRKTRVRSGNVFISDPATSGSPYLGQSVSVVGKQERGKSQIKAEEIVFPTAPERKLSGFAIIDRVISPAKTVGGETRMVVRADGYIILINSSSKTDFQKPLTSLSSVTTNVWIKYRGKLQSDGIVRTDSAILVANAIRDDEAKLLDKNDYDATAVAPDAKQSFVSEMYHGLDPKKIPPYKNASMQARVDRIGTSIIPAYQRKLPESDLTKILFHFQLVDRPDFLDCWALPSGIILVPRHIVEQLQNDQELAAVLADSVADVLEKQAYRSQANRRNRKIAEFASAAGGLSMIGVVSLANLGAEASDERTAEDQSGRVSLGLLHDAGYEIDQAPIAWRRLCTKGGKTLADTPIPRRALNLYKSIGITWHTYSDALEPASAAPQAQ